MTSHVGLAVASLKVNSLMRGILGIMYLHVASSLRLSCAS